MKKTMLILDILLLTKRSLIGSIRNPFIYIPNFIMSLFIFEGMRALLIKGWMPSHILYGFLVGFIGSVITITIATMNARRAFHGE